ncbi:hypothetical protein BACUNI_02189 [Bacteroides uniformis ATCC 8492]|uniref:Uncharacterized protein n=1 Tax=Bacteroides uniformis (strain ATCC 8492 / DSM 6597 / CCUG 4942 / CIP 103695 / JCM 5828 / KCTC 5204 / NCTC 13054 / VPI 0061) TaxID=411479 RepID=A0ABC9NC07_BACUC|nr:hypothetical protein BACUNI_02189 [Bacteroides uniformis ATCC 8492]
MQGFFCLKISQKSLSTFKKCNINITLISFLLVIFAT